MTTADAQAHKPPAAHPGLGWWNLYFILKVMLYFLGRIDFHALENISFAGLLLIPLRNRFLIVARQIIAVPLGIWLFHYDSFLPPLDRLFAQLDQLLAFEPAYLLELLLRFVPGNALLALGLVTVAYYFAAKLFRVSVIVVLALFATGFQTVENSFPVAAIAQGPSQNAALATATDTGNDRNLNNYLNEFFANERSRQVPLQRSPDTNNRFDILFLSVCSLAWDDMEITGVTGHPLMQQFDIIFDQFNAATSYSGPALLRLSRASCGQPSHKALYESAAPECRLFENLARLGYQEALLMNHDGVFNSLLERTRQFSGIDAPLFPQDGLEVTQKAFAGSPVYSDLELLSRWWSARLQEQGKPVVALYNSATLHDGNRILHHKPVFGVESYRLRINTLFDELNQFIKQLQKSDRNIVVVLIPEHGGGLRGDKMQISGMREIPSPSITHIPVAVKLIGPGLQRRGAVARVPQATSHMSLAQLIDNIIEQGVFSGRNFSAADLARGMPETPSVSQNEGSTVIALDNQYFISLDNEDWSQYPAQ